jgi:hypothetical protein
MSGASHIITFHCEAPQQSAACARREPRLPLLFPLAKSPAGVAGRRSRSNQRPLSTTLPRAALPGSSSSVAHPATKGKGPLATNSRKRTLQPGKRSGAAPVAPRCIVAGLHPAPPTSIACIALQRCNDATTSLPRATTPGLNLPRLRQRFARRQLSGSGQGAAAKLSGEIAAGRPADVRRRTLSARRAGSVSRR